MTPGSAAAPLSFPLPLPFPFPFPFPSLSSPSEAKEGKRRDETRRGGRGWSVDFSQPKPSKGRHQGRSDAGPTRHLWGPTAFSRQNKGTSRSWTISFLRLRKEGIRGDALLGYPGRV